MIGRTLDRYRIEAKLGEGGMGVVYRARDTHLNRDVAIKILPHDKLADPKRKERFVQEAKAASALNHPNIITVHDIRSDAGIDFIVMEYASGRTLDQVIPAKGLGVGQSLRYGIQIADALAKAHEAGIVHRDLKPSNAIVTADDRIKLLDFGLAKLLDPADDEADARTRTSPITDAGMVIGTAAYMSPEQADGRKVDARADVFSFGAVLYEMITGRRPFAGESNLSVLAKVLNDDPVAPSALSPSIPADVERTILRCLRKDPARRYQTMADLKVALEDLAADSAVAQLPQVRDVKARRAWRWGWLALIPVLLIAAYVVSQSMRPPARTAPLGAVPLTALPAGVVQSPCFSPDGNHVVFVWNGPKEDNVDLYVQQIGAGSPLRLTTDPADDYRPAWSPDGRAIAFLRQSAEPRRHELRLIAPLGGTERKLADIRPRGFLRPVTLAWCPDSTCVVLTDSPDEAKPDALFVVSTESGEKRQLTSPEAPLLADTDPDVSPDGRWLVFRRDSAPFSGQLQLAPLGERMTVVGDARTLTPLLLAAAAPKWISNNEIIFGAKSALWTLRTARGSTPERLPFVGEDGQMPTVFRPQAQRPGRLVYVRSYVDTNIWRIDTSGPAVPASAAPVRVISSTRRESAGQLSPDGRRLAFLSNRSGESEIWVADSSGANAVQLTSMGANPGLPRWSPDGNFIAFQSNAEDQAAGDVYVIPAGGGRPRNLTSHPASDVFPSFSHDGKWIYFASTRTGTFFIWKMPVSGGNAVQVSPTSGIVSIESPDGAFLYYVETTRSDRPGPLWRLPLDGGRPSKVADRMFAFDFDVLDRGIYYMERLPGGGRITYLDFATERSTVVAEHLGNLLTLASSLSVARDGRAIFFSRVDAAVDELMLVDNFR